MVLGSTSPKKALPGGLLGNIVRQQCEVIHMGYSGPEAPGQHAGRQTAGRFEQSNSSYPFGRWCCQSLVRPGCGERHPDFGIARKHWQLIDAAVAVAVACDLDSPEGE